MSDSYIYYQVAGSYQYMTPNALITEDVNQAAKFKVGSYGTNVYTGGNGFIQPNWDFPGYYFVNDGTVKRNVALITRPFESSINIQKGNNVMTGTPHIGWGNSGYTGLYIYGDYKITFKTNAGDVVIEKKDGIDYYNLNQFYLPDQPDGRSTPRYFTEVIAETLVRQEPLGDITIISMDDKISKNFNIGDESSDLSIYSPLFFKSIRVNTPKAIKITVYNRKNFTYETSLPGVYEYAENETINPNPIYYGEFQSIKVEISNKKPLPVGVVPKITSIYPNGQVREIQGFGRFSLLQAGISTTNMTLTGPATFIFNAFTYLKENKDCKIYEFVETSKEINNPDITEYVLIEEYRTPTNEDIANQCGGNKLFDFYQNKTEGSVAFPVSSAYTEIGDVPPEAGAIQFKKLNSHIKLYKTTDRTGDYFLIQEKVGSPNNAFGFDKGVYKTYIFQEGNINEPSGGGGGGNAGKDITYVSTELKSELKGEDETIPVQSYLFVLGLLGGFLIFY